MNDLDENHTHMFKKRGKKTPKCKFRFSNAQESQWSTKIIILKMTIDKTIRIYQEAP